MCRADYEKYEYLIGMDDRNISNMIRIAGGDLRTKIYKLLMFADDQVILQIHGTRVSLDAHMKILSEAVRAA